MYKISKKIKYQIVLIMIVNKNSKMKIMKKKMLYNYYKTTNNKINKMKYNKSKIMLNKKITNNSNKITII